MSKVLILVGSPNREGSVSKDLAENLGRLITAKGGLVEIVDVLGMMDQPDGLSAVISKWTGSDIIVLSYPMHADAPPAGVVRMFEQLYARRDDLTGMRSFLAIGNCGNPDPGRLAVSMEIFHHFADHLRLHWLGGLCLPMGFAFEDRPIGTAGRRSRHVLAALELTAEALSQGKAVPDEAMKEMSKRPMTELLYINEVNHNLKLKAKLSGARARLDERPYGR